MASEVRLGQGLRYFPDHQDSLRWWYLPAELELVREGGAPAFAFERFRYKGTTATADAERFWTRSVLRFSVRLEADPGGVEALRSHLEARARRAVRLEPVPISGIRSSLVYAGSERGTGGEIASGSWDDEPERWSEQTYEVSLDSLTADLLWDSLHDGSLALSLSYTLSAEVVPHRPGSLGAGTTTNGTSAEPELVERALGGDSLALDIAPTDCPRCFRIVDLDTRIPADYPFLEIYCHDFAAGAVPQDLRLVVVQVRAVAVNGDRPIEAVEFAPPTGSREEVRFRFAVELDDGYEFQVTREYDHATESEPWQRVASWTGSLDVTRFRDRIEDGPAGARLDPRELY